MLLALLPPPPPLGRRAFPLAPPASCPWTPGLAATGGAWWAWGGRGGGRREGPRLKRRERYGYKIKTWTHDFPEEPRRIKKALGKRRSGTGIDERKMYQKKRKKNCGLISATCVGSRTFVFFRIFVANPPLNLCAYAYFPYFSTATLFTCGDSRQV